MEEDEESSAFFSDLEGDIVDIVNEQAECETADIRFGCKFIVRLNGLYLTPIRTEEKGNRAGQYMLSERLACFLHFISFLFFKV